VILCFHIFKLAVLNPMKYDGSEGHERAVREAREEASDRLESFRGYLHHVLDLRSSPNIARDHSDIVQQTFLDAHQQHLEGNAPQESKHYRHWIRRILCCNIVDAMRRSTRQKRDIRIETRDTNSGATSSSLCRMDDLPAEQSSPSRCCMRSENAKSVQAAMEQLPEHYRHVIHARFFECQPCRDIGKQMGKSEAAVASILFRAIRQMRDELTKLGVLPASD
jgi:RNA polymerase sigma-70 factor, ECF subfamily